MEYSDKSYNLRIELDTHNCELSPAQIEQFEAGLAPLREPTSTFPVSDLYVTITHHPRSQQYRVKAALVLPKRTFASGDLAEHPYAAFEHCIRKLVARVEAYKAELSAEPEARKHQKGTHQEVVPTREPEAGLLEVAVRAGDYADFRKAMSVYEEPVRKRAGRWIQRFPELEARLGEQISLEDVVEEIFLNAFQRFDAKPDEVRLGDWLEHLIDPSLKLLAHHPDEEIENISFARTLRETE